MVEERVDRLSCVTYRSVLYLQRILVRTECRYGILTLNLTLLSVILDEIRNRNKIRASDRHKMRIAVPGTCTFLSIYLHIYILTPVVEIEPCCDHYHHHNE